MSEAGANSLLKIARVLKSNGTDGEILMGFREVYPEDIDLNEPVFIEFDGLPVPFFIEEFQPKGTTKALVRLTGVKSLADAEELVGKDVSVEEGTLDLEEEEGLGDITGWTLVQDGGIEIGTVEDYEDIPGNPCIYVETAAGSKMIPLHEDLIVDADPEARRLTMRIPSGLLD